MFLLALSLHISQPDKAIVMYRNVHTGPKIQDGGVHEGLIKDGYQVLTDPAVYREPARPTAKTINTKSASAAALDLFT